VLGGRTLEARARKAVQPPDHEGRECRRQHLGVDAWAWPTHPRRRWAQALAQRGLDLVEELVHALLQPLVLEHQRITHHHARHARVLLGELQHHRHDLGAWRPPAAASGRRLLGRQSG
jgi:hypothetical protein